ncbi:MAG: DUF4405 domain-containing protein [Candidatus Sumerlaeia bacterium]|nr:DUF4405 domain-containing protein [Candidatus Sumerlaeia bacterium]
MMHFTKKHAYFLLDGLALALLCALGATGMLIHYTLPAGSGSRLEVLGLTRHDWGGVHFWIAIGFLSAIALHALLHRRWIWAIATGTPGRARKWRIVGFSMATVVLVALILVPLTLHPDSSTAPAAADDVEEASHGARDGRGEGRGTGRGLRRGQGPLAPTPSSTPSSSARTAQ